MRRINGILKEKTRYELITHSTCGLDCAMLSIRIGRNECMPFIF